MNLMSQQLISDASKYKFGALNPGFDLNVIFGQELESSLPADAHLLARGRLSISLTTTTRRNVIVSRFESKTELIEALICSCFLPGFSSTKMPSYKVS